MRKQYRLKSEVSVSNSTSINFITKPPSNEPRGIRGEFPGLKGRAGVSLENFIGMQKRYAHCFTERERERERERVSKYKNANTDYVTRNQRVMLFNVGDLCRFFSFFFFFF